MNKTTKIVLAVALVPVLLIGTCTLFVGGAAVVGAGAVAGSVAATENKSDRITLDSFNKLANGISYKDAVAILGREGEVLSEVNVADIHTVMYSWKNGISNMNATFQNDKLMSKAQLGLR